MKTASFALILLAGATAFSGIARADETETAVNQESARVARDSAGLFHGAPVLESRHLGVQHQPAASGTATSREDRFLFSLGDRGLGNN